MPGESYQRFVAAKQCLRRHPDYSDEQVAEAIGISARELALSGPGSAADILKQARADFRSEYQQTTHFTGGGPS